MSRVKVTYEGDLHTIAVHEATGESLHTDAPLDNQGLGRTFSPTDLVGTALATCMATVMGIYAKRHQLDLRGLTIEVVKTMTKEGVRRIASLECTITFPSTLSDVNKKKLIEVAESCPVQHSLHPDVRIIVNIN